MLKVNKYKIILLILLVICGIAAINKLYKPKNDKPIETTSIQETHASITSDIATGSELQETLSVEDVKKSIMETASAEEITAEDYKDAKEIENIMKRIREKTDEK